MAKWRRLEGLVGICMPEEIFVFLVFIFCFGLHSLTHRLLLCFQIRSLFSAVFYLLGIVFLIFVEPVSFILIALFVLAIFLVITLYFPHILTAQTPADIILQALQKKQQLSKEALYHLFSEKKLIDVRCDDLVRTKMIQRINQRLYVSRVGTYAWYIIYNLSHFFGIPISG